MDLTIKHFNELSICELYEILKARSAIFVVEQNCVYQDIDDKDKGAYHLFLKENGILKAYLRILEKGVSYKEVSIGRVITTKHGEGYGGKILKEGICFAKEKMNAEKIRIGAQLYAKEFYEKHGFVQVSEPFLEDGILHIEMLWKI